MRHWEIIIWPKEYWFFHVAKKFGKNKPFLIETWIGPFCFRWWTDARSARKQWIRKMEKANE